MPLRRDEQAGPAVREARAELHEAARRYGEQRPELRIEFLAAVNETMDRMVRLAKHLGSPPGIDPTLGIKRVFVRRFPFSVHFIIELPTRFRVLAGDGRPRETRLGTARDPSLEYVPWKRGAYWALACHPTECFVIAATRVL